MKTALIAAVFTAIAGCAASDPLVDSSANAAAGGTQPELENVREVAIESFADEPVCTHQAPTGSRIAVERCETRDPANEAAQASILNQTREDLDEMRRRQLYQEQARQQALREAVLRPRGP